MHVRIRSRHVTAAALFLTLSGALSLSPSLAKPAAPAAAARMTPVDFPTLKRAVANRKGKVVVVNYWATWCGPCLEKMPSLKKLSDRYTKQGMELMNVSFDSRRSVDAAAKTLAKHGLTKNSYLQKGSLEQFVVGMEPKFPTDEAVNLPRTYIFDRQGKLVKIYDDAQDTTAIEKTVKAELARSR